MSNEKYRSTEAAAYIGKSLSWLNQSRQRGDGPIYAKVGGSVWYFKGDLDAWLATKRRRAVYDHAGIKAAADVLLRELGLLEAA